MGLLLKRDWLAVLVTFVVLELYVVRCCTALSLTSLRNVLVRKMAENSGQQATESNETSQAQCTGLCDVTTSCRSLTLTCHDLDLGLEFATDLDLLLLLCRSTACSTGDSHREVTQEPTSFTVTQETTSVTSTLSAPLQPHCSLPPLIDRTSVTRTVTSTHDVAQYRCNVTTDVYVSGTTDVTCGPGENWPDATILCAPTTCWYTHAHVGPVYSGTLAVTRDGIECQTWALDHPHQLDAIYQPDSAYPSDNCSKAEATNYCRIFDDGWTPAWCYRNKSTSWPNWWYCDVDRCEAVPGVRLG